MSTRQKDRDKRDPMESVPRDLPMPVYEYFVADSGSFATQTDSRRDPLKDDQPGAFLQNVCLRF